MKYLKEGWAQRGQPGFAGWCLRTGHHGHTLQGCLNVRKSFSLRAAEHTLSREALESSSLWLFKGYLDMVLGNQRGVALPEQENGISRDPCQPKPSCDS